jgi:hypothetical protein
MRRSAGRRSKRRHRDCPPAAQSHSIVLEQHGRGPLPARNIARATLPGSELARLLRTIFRRTWLTAVFIVVLTLGFFISIGFDQVGLFDWVTVPLSVALLVFVPMRFGLSALIVAFSVAGTLGNFPLTADFSTWYAGSSISALASVLAPTAYALYTALAGRPLF